MSRADTRARARGRAVKPRKAGPLVRIRPVAAGRETGFEVDCRRDDPLAFAEAHGAMPALAPSKAAARLAAEEHLRNCHGGRGQIFEGRP